MRKLYVGKASTQIDKLRQRRAVLLNKGDQQSMMEAEEISRKIQQMKVKK